MAKQFGLRLLPIPRFFFILLASLALAGDPAPEISHWILIPDPRPETLDSLIREQDMRGRYGDFHLAVGSPSEFEGVPGARSIGSVNPAEEVFLFWLQEGERLLHPEGVRILHRQGNQVVVGLSKGITPHQLRQHGKRPVFHDGVVPVARRAVRPLADVLGGGALFAAPPFDSRIQSWVDSIDKANLQADITSLATLFSTRRSDDPESINAQNWIKARFDALGLTTSLHDFDSGSDNVVADIPGTLEPDKVVIIGAHYDSINYSGSVAPGADDNASGTAALMEMARVFTAGGASFRYTVRFIAFASEEFGLIGSAAYSADMVSQGVEVVAMLNTDMNSHRANGDAHDLDMITNDTTQSLTDLLVEISELYVPGLPVVQAPLFAGTSDHRSFYNDGFPAAFYFEDADSYSPYIHGPNDTVGTSANDFDLAEDIVKSITAGAAVLADPVDLQISHTALGDTPDEWNPVVVWATSTSLIGSTVQGMTLYFDSGSGEQAAPMFATGNADEWIGQIPPGPAGTNISYRLEAVDDNGFTEQWPPGGSTSPYMIGVRNTFYSEGFEGGDGGWTHGGTEDDWMRGTPQGKSTDPGSAYEGANVFCNDLGQSGFNGDYRPNTACWLRSPSIDSSAHTGVRLRYARWLGVEDAVYDQADIRINGNIVWSNPVGGGTDHLIDNQWILHDLDISAFADGNSNTRIRYWMTSDGGVEFGGWNVDSIELYTLASGIKPDLYRDSAFVSTSAGGSVNLEIDLGPGHGNRNYIMLGGISGTVPGFTLSGVQVDLNWDAITTLFLQLAGSLPGFLGTTDANGRATATLNAPAGLDPALIGTTFYFAGLTLGPVDRATQTVEVLFVE